MNLQVLRQLLEICSNLQIQKIIVVGTTIRGNKVSFFAIEDIYSLVESFLPENIFDRRF